MNNCIITKFMAVVENDNLVKVGELRFKILGEHLLKIGTTKYPVATEMSILDTYPNVVFTNNNERTISIDHLERNRTASADCEIVIKDKYKIATFIADGNSPTEFNIDDFQFCPIKKLGAYSGADGSTGKITGHFSKVPSTVEELDLYSKGVVLDAFPELQSLKVYNVAISEVVDINTIINNCPSIQSIYSFYGNIKGNIETLPTMTGVTLLRLEQRGSAKNEVTGNIASLGSWVGLTTLTISDSKISGNIADFLDAMYNDGNGRTSGSITIKVNNIVTNVSGASSTQTYNFSSSGWTMA